MRKRVVENGLLQHKKEYIFSIGEGKEIEDAIKQVNVTQKFKQSILSRNLVRFLENGENIIV